MELISLKNVSKRSKVALLKELGYDADDIFVYDSNGDKIKDPYIDEEIRIDNMFISPFSCTILDDNPLSIASYFEEKGEVIWIMTHLESLPERSQRAY